VAEFLRGEEKMDKDVGEKMVRVCQSLIKMLELSFQGFRKHTEESLNEAEKAKDEIRKNSSELAQLLILKSSPYEKGKEWAKPYLSMASSFDRMTFNIEGMVDRLKSKVQNKILFSDRAVKEINDIFQGTMDLLESLPNLILTQNKLLAQHIGEQVRSLFTIATGYSEEHEERLIQGICVPKHSPIYLGILESLKGIITQTLEVSGKIVSLSSKSGS
jgi:Na+/phosphate symporter